MFTRPRVSLSAIFFFCYCTPSVARAIWTQENFDSSGGSVGITKRDPSQCGGHSELQQCGTSYPPNFCCPAAYQCLPLNGTTAKAVICCPLGHDCNTIRPIHCNPRAQNAALSPGNLIHSTPQLQLSTCGNDHCCPEGYTCQGGMCFAIKGSVIISSTTSTTASTPTSTSTSSSVTSAASSTAPSTAKATTTYPSFLTTSIPSASNTGHSSGNTTSQSDPFNGSSFAAGFIPGLALGAIFLAIVLWLLARRRKGSDSYVGEKSRDRDTLTDLSTLPASTSSNHGRSISEPTMDPSMSYRTDFLRGTPPRSNDITISSPMTSHNRYETPGSSTTAQTLKSKPTFSHSPFIDRAPSTPAPTQVPNHLKRGTLSFKISPVRALKKQRSIHSLRRQITNASSCTTNPSRNGSNRSQAQGAASRSRSRSTETIQVLMPSTEPYTPDRRAQMPSLTPELDEPSYDLPDSPSSWESDGSIAGVPVTTSPPDPTPDLRQTYQRHQPQQQQLPPQTRQATLPAHATPKRSTDRNLLGSPYTTPNNAATRGQDSAVALTMTTPPTVASMAAANAALPLAMRSQAPPPLRIPSAEARQGQAKSQGKGQGQSFSMLMEKAGMSQEMLIGAAGSPAGKGKGRLR